LEQTYMPQETLTQLLSSLSREVVSEQEGEAGVSISVLENSIARSSQRYGRAIPAALIRLLKGSIFMSRNNLEYRVSSVKVHEASTHLSRLLEKARSGEVQLVGGYKQGSPVMVISLDQFAEELGHAMSGQSIVDLLPASRPPLNETLPLGCGRRASESAVLLGD
jgi:fructose-specific phosphotransferase system component IIB